EAQQIESALRTCEENDIQQQEENEKNKANILCTTEISSNILLNTLSINTLIDASESNNLLIDASASSNMLLDALVLSNMLLNDEAPNHILLDARASILDASALSNILLNDEAPKHILLDAEASSNPSLSQPFQEILQISPSSADIASILHMHLEDINKQCQIKKLLKGNTSIYDYLRLLSNYMSRCIRTWGDCYIESRELPFYHQGKHKKSTSLFDNKDFLKECKKWLQQQSPES
ncbi:14046_t:CDS:2, partial [Gigaspora rosea]